MAGMWTKKNAKSCVKTLQAQGFSQSMLLEIRSLARCSPENGMSCAVFIVNSLLHLRRSTLNPELRQARAVH